MAVQVHGTTNRGSCVKALYAILVPTPQIASLKLQNLVNNHFGSFQLTVGGNAHERLLYVLTDLRGTTASFTEPGQRPHETGTTRSRRA